MKDANMTEITGGEMQAKYGDAVIMFLRQREAVDGPKPVYYKVLMHNVGIMIGLTYEEKVRVTAKQGDSSAQKSIFYTNSWLKYHGLIDNKEEGFWGLTKKGRESRLYHEEYRDMYKEWKRVKNEEWKRVKNEELAEKKLKNQQNDSK